MRHGGGFGRQRGCKLAARALLSYKICYGSCKNDFSRKVLTAINSLRVSTNVVNTLACLGVP